MANICLGIGTRAAPEKIRKAITTVEGLRAWWTDGAGGDPEEGGTLVFRFGGNAGFDMRVTHSDESRVQWECVRGPDDWLGTRIEFDIAAEEGQNRLLFRHEGWREENRHFHHCATKWATFLLSLRDYVESGKGRPFPEDVKIEAVAA